jgi:hypothetical protein
VDCTKLATGLAGPHPFDLRQVVYNLPDRSRPRPLESMPVGSGVKAADHRSI